MLLGLFPEISFHKMFESRALRNKNPRAGKFLLQQQNQFGILSTKHNSRQGWIQEKKRVRR